MVYNPLNLLKRINLRQATSSHYILLSLLFFAGLELIAWWHRWIIVLVIVLLFLVILGIVLLRLEEEISWQLSEVVLPIMAAASFVSFSLFLPQTFLRHIFYAAAALIFYWLLKNGVRRAYPTWNWGISTAIVLVGSAAILGIRWHLYTSILTTLALVAFMIFMMTLQAWLPQTKNRNRALLLSAGLTLALTEITWVLLFLPWHFLILAGIIATIFYVAFHLISINLERPIKRQDLHEYLLVGSISLLILLSLGVWQ